MWDVAHILYIECIASYIVHLGRHFNLSHLPELIKAAKSQKVFSCPLNLHANENKPERVFGLKVRCRELDIFKILEFFEKLFGIFFRFFFFFLDFFGNLLGIFMEEFFGRIFLGGFFCFYC